MTARLVTTEAHIYVADIRAACDFYTRTLGFEIAFLFGDPPTYGQVQRGEGRLAMRLVCSPVIAADVREREELLSASFTVGCAADIRALFAEFEASGAPFRQRLERKSWGALNFIVRDPDGNLVLFAGPAD